MSHGESRSTRRHASRIVRREAAELDFKGERGEWPPRVHDEQHQGARRFDEFTPSSQEDIFGAAYGRGAILH
jgi:hypothetical protein